MVDILFDGVQGVDQLDLKCPKLPCNALVHDWIKRTCGTASIELLIFMGIELRFEDVETRPWRNYDGPLNLQQQRECYRELRD